MKLAALGVVTLGIGIALGIDGLLLTGGLWIVLGLLLRVVVMRGRERTEGPASYEDGGGVTVTDEDPGRSGSRAQRLPVAGMLVLGVIGVASLLIGILAIGFPEPDRDWRWLPIGIGALQCGIVFLSTAMYALGSGIQAVTGNPTHPARITIEGSRETGTYINERPRLEFELLVEPEGRPSYRVAKKATVPHTALGSIAIGDGFEALVDLDKPDGVAIDWDAPIPGEGGGGDVSERIEKLQGLRDGGVISATEYETQRRRILDSI